MSSAVLERSRLLLSATLVVRLVRFDMFRDEPSNIPVAHFAS
jgi:hypothetical protein